MQPGDKVYFNVLKDCVNNYSGTILEDLGDMFLVENKGYKTYVKKDRVTRDLKSLLDITFD